MITLRKITYVVGLSIAVSVFVLFLYSFLPHLIQNNAWDNLDSTNLTKEEMLEKFKEHPAYVVFYEKFPDAKEELNYNKRSRSGDLKVGIRNFETGTELVLQMNYNKYNDNVNVHINCHAENINELNIISSSLRASGLFVVDFIEHTDCLDLVPSKTNTSFNTRTIENGTMVTLERIN